jgi:chemotaxis protein CheZ
MEPSASATTAGEAAPESHDVHHRIGQLTRQLHDALRELGLAEKLHGTAEELPDAKSRLTYIARLTGEAAEKVLNRVDQAKNQNEQIAAQTRHMIALLVADPVAAVAKGHIMNFLTDLEKANQDIDQHLTEIMMAQDFHDLTGQVIARVVTLATNIEQQLVELLIQTAPPGAALQPPTAEGGKPAAQGPALQGPVVDPDKSPDVVTSQSQVDELLASLGF